MEKLWSDVDQYFGDILAPVDPELAATLAANEAAGLPAIDVSRLQGKFLDLLVRISGATRILEVGTLGGYSTIWMARAAGAHAKITTIEFNQRHAEAARKNIENAGMQDRVDIKIGAALDVLPALENTAPAPYDLIFIDADKANNANYLSWAKKLSRPGSIIIVDNVVRDGKIIQADSEDPNILGTRKCAEMLGADPDLSGTVLQTVGAKGYDGFLMAIVK